MLSLSFGQIVEWCLAAYVLLGSSSIAYILLRTGWPNIRTIGIAYKSGWSIVFGLVFSLGITGLSVATLLLKPKNLAFGLPEILLMNTAIVSAAGMGLFTLKRKMATQRTVTVAVPKRIVTASIVSKMVMEKIPESEYVKAGETPAAIAATTPSVPGPVAVPHEMYETIEGGITIVSSKPRGKEAAKEKTGGKKSLTLEESAKTTELKKRLLKIGKVKTWAEVAEEETRKEIVFEPSKEVIEKVIEKQKSQQKHEATGITPEEITPLPKPSEEPKTVARPGENKPSLSWLFRGITGAPPKKTLEQIVVKEKPGTEKPVQSPAQPPIPAKPVPEKAQTKKAQLLGPPIAPKPVPEKTVGAAQPKLIAAPKPIKEEKKTAPPKAPAKEEKGPARPQKSLWESLFPPKPVTEKHAVSTPEKIPQAKPAPTTELKPITAMPAKPKLISAPKPIAEKTVAPAPQKLVATPKPLQEEKKIVPLAPSKPSAEAKKPLFVFPWNKPAGAVPPKAVIEKAPEKAPLPPATPKTEKTIPAKPPAEKPHAKMPLPPTAPAPPKAEKPLHKVEEAVPKKPLSVEIPTIKISFPQILPKQEKTVARKQAGAEEKHSYAKPEPYIETRPQSAERIAELRKRLTELDTNKPLGELLKKEYPKQTLESLKEELTIQPGKGVEPEKKKSVEEIMEQLEREKTERESPAMTHQEIHEQVHDSTAFIRQELRRRLGLEAEQKPVDERKTAEEAMPKSARLLKEILKEA